MRPALLTLSRCGDSAGIGTYRHGGDDQSSYAWRSTYQSAGCHWGGPAADYRLLESRTRTPRGEALEFDLNEAPDRATRKQTKLRVDSLHLSAFGPGSNEAPLETTGCLPVRIDEAVRIERDDPRLVETPHPARYDGPGRYYFHEGSTLEGVDRLTTPQDIGDRLTELGICHEFRYSYPGLSDEYGPGGGSERWCSVPDVQSLKDIEAVPDGLELHQGGQVFSRGPFKVGVNDAGYVQIYVRDEEPRDRRASPLVGRDCPTY